MENSFVKLLQKVGLKRPFTIPKSFQTSPNNLKQIMRILNQPPPLIGDFSKNKIIDFEEDDAQGITYAFGNTWFLSSQNKIFKYLIVGDDLQHPQRKEKLGQVALSSLM
jgi:hypothetical protein